jgi:predicted nucleic acid-binding Zn ribbon protein
LFSQAGKLKLQKMYSHISRIGLSTMESNLFKFIKPHHCLECQRSLQEDEKHYCQSCHANLESTQKQLQKEQAEFVARKDLTYKFYEYLDRNHEYNESMDARGQFATGLRNTLRELRKTDSSIDGVFACVRLLQGFSRRQSNQDFYWLDPTTHYMSCSTDTHTVQQPSEYGFYNTITFYSPCGACYNPLPNSQMQASENDKDEPKYIWGCVYVLRDDYLKFYDEDPLHTPFFTEELANQAREAIANKKT